MLDCVYRCMYMDVVFELEWEQVGLYKRDDWGYRGGYNCMYMYVLCGIGRDRVGV